MVAAVDEHGADERGNGGKSAGKKRERGEERRTSGQQQEQKSRQMGILRERSEE